MNTPAALLIGSWNNIWTTRDKQRIKVKDMNTEHIKHCINMLRKIPEYEIIMDIWDEPIEISTSFNSKTVEEWIDIFEYELMRRDFKK